MGTIKKSTEKEIQVLDDLLDLPQSNKVIADCVCVFDIEGKIVKAGLSLQASVALWIPEAHSIIEEIYGEVKKSVFVKSLASVLAEGTGHLQEVDYSRKARNLLNAKDCLLVIETLGLEFITQNTGGKGAPTVEVNPPKTKDKGKSETPKTEKVTENPLAFSVDFATCKSSEEKFNKLISFTREMARELRIEFKGLGLENALRDLILKVK